MARPSEPGWSGWSTGDGTTSAPHVSIRILRYGFCWYEARTMYTLHSRSNCAHANDSAVPHWPAPVSVDRRAIALGLVVERLRNRGVRLVRAGGRDRLVLEVDARRCTERALQTIGAHERRRAPQLEDVEHLARARRSTAPSTPLGRSGPWGRAARGRRGRRARWWRDAAGVAAAPASPATR